MHLNMPLMNTYHRGNSHLYMSIQLKAVSFGNGYNSAVSSAPGNKEIRNNK